MGRLSFRSGGESHGRGCLALLEGVPKGLELDTDFIDAQLARRQRGYGRGGRQKIETDRVQVLGGVRGGRTLGSPLVLFVENRDYKIEEMPDLTRPRPGHADLSGCLRHGDRDIRANIERSSARETAARVAAGAVAQLILRALGAEVLGHVVRIGSVAVPGAAGSSLADCEALVAARARVTGSPFGLADDGCSDAMRAAIDEALRGKDSLGGVAEVVAHGVPPGLGSFAQWNEKLDGRLAQALMSIQAVKAVEIGMGHEVGALPGSAVHDPIEVERAEGATELTRPSNNAGGLEGGVTNGAPLVVRATKKPIATLRRRLMSVDLASGDPAEAAFERSDVCAVPAFACIAEAMVALTLADAALELFGGASLEALVEARDAHAARVARVLSGAEEQGGSDGSSAGPRKEG